MKIVDMTVLDHRNYSWPFKQTSTI